MISIARLTKQGSRRFPAARSSPSIQASPLFAFGSYSVVTTPFIQVSNELIGSSTITNELVEQSSILNELVGLSTVVNESFTI